MGAAPPRRQRALAVVAAALLVLLWAVWLNRSGDIGLDVRSDPGNAWALALFLVLPVAVGAFWPTPWLALVALVIPLVPVLPSSCGTSRQGDAVVRLCPPAPFEGQTLVLAAVTALLVLTGVALRRAARPAS